MTTRGFSPICDPPRFFFKNWALSLLYPYGALASCKKLEKTNEQSLRYLKTDHRPRTDHGRTTDIGDYIGPLWINQGPKLLDSRGVKAVPAILSSYIYLLMSCWIKCRSMQNQQNPANVSNVGSHGNCHLFWPLTLINFHEPIQSAKRINNCKTRQ